MNLNKLSIWWYGLPTYKKKELYLKYFNGTYEKESEISEYRRAAMYERELELAIRETLDFFSV